MVIMDRLLVEKSQSSVEDVMTPNRFINIMHIFNCAYLMAITLIASNYIASLIVLAIYVAITIAANAKEKYNE